MSTDRVNRYYKAILQTSFEISSLIDKGNADEILKQLADVLYCENDGPTEAQIIKALSIFRSYPSLRERVRKLMGEDSLGDLSNLEFKPSPGEPMYIDIEAKGRWLICPKDGERVWDYEISAGERRLCLKHHMYFVLEDQITS